MDRQVWPGKSLLKGCVLKGNDFFFIDCTLGAFVFTPNSFTPFLLVVLTLIVNGNVLALTTIKFHDRPNNDQTGNTYRRIASFHMVVR